MAISAIILAGGRSKRMGQDKAFMMFKGKSFIQNIIDAVKPITSDIIISGNDKRLLELGYAVIKDEVKNGGPVFGIASSMKYVKGEKVFVLSCDTPQITKKALETLISNHNNADIVCYKYNDRVMPLVGLYNIETEFVFTKAMKDDIRRLFSVIENLEVSVLEYKEEKGLKNINSLMDLKYLA